MALACVGLRTRFLSAFSIWCDFFFWLVGWLYFYCYCLIRCSNSNRRGYYSPRVLTEHKNALWPNWIFFLLYSCSIWQGISMPFNALFHFRCAHLADQWLFSWLVLTHSVQHICIDSARSSSNSIRVFCLFFSPYSLVGILHIFTRWSPIRFVGIIYHFESTFVFCFSELSCHCYLRIQ